MDWIWTIIKEHSVVVNNSLAVVTTHVENVKVVSSDGEALTKKQ